jgi:hypothetical protein
MSVKYPYGSSWYETSGYTKPNSQRPNWPIKQVFQVVNSSGTNTEPAANKPDWAIIRDGTKYWQPYVTPQSKPHISTYITYNTNDEFTYQSGFLPISTVDLVLPTATKGIQVHKEQFVENNTSKVYANEIYSVTKDFFIWSDTGLPDSKNPYSTYRIPKWRKQSDTLSQDYTPYWYHPSLKQFFPVSKKLADAQYNALAKVDLYTAFRGEASEFNLSTFTKAKIEYLESTGLSNREAVEKARAEAAAASAAAAAGKGGVGGTASSRSSATKNATSSRTNQSGATAQGEYSQNDAGTPNRAVVATIKKSINSRVLALGDTTKAEMIQYYRAPDGDYSLTPDRFQFRYYPNNVSYTDLGANWTEVDRVNNSPFVDFRNFKLMKISFEFVVGDNTNLMTSCDDELKMLRQMATRPESVIFLGMDKMFTEQLIYPSWTGGSGIEFAIVDLTINSVQRVQQPPDANSSSSPRGEIARATCNITMQELPLEGPNLIVLPRLVEISTPTPGTPTTGGTCIPLFWSQPGVTKNRDASGCPNEQTVP